MENEGRRLFSTANKSRAAIYIGFICLLFLMIIAVFLVGRTAFEPLPEQELSHTEPDAAAPVSDPPGSPDTAPRDAEAEVPKPSVVAGSTATPKSKSPTSIPPWIRSHSDDFVFENGKRPVSPIQFDKNSPKRAARQEETEDTEEKEANADKPFEARRFRNLQMQDEKGEIPIDGLQKAQKHIDRMRAHRERLAAAAGKADGIEIAGLQPSDWAWLGPGNVGGRIRSIVIDPNNANNLIVGSVSGGIWRSTDTGNSWQPVNDFMANLAISSMVRNPNNANEIYAGTGELFAASIGSEGQDIADDGLRGLGIFKSIDGGTTWNQLASTDPAVPAVCAAAGGSCPWSYVNRLAISPNGSTILAATVSGIWSSSNAGQTWTPAAGASGIVFDIDFDPADNLKAIAGGGGAAAYSLDGGANWLPANFPAAISGRVEVAYAPSSPSIVYASVDQNQGEVYVSNNGGQSYAQVNTGNNFLGTQGGYDNIIWVNPLDPTFVIVGGIHLWRSTDSGTNFTQISRNDTSSAHPDHHMIVASAGFNNTSDKSVYFANDGGIFRADDVSTVSETNGWTHRNHRLGVTQFYGGAVSATGTVFGGTQDNGNVRVLPTPNLDPPYDSETWDRYVGGDGGFVAADPTDANFLYSEYTDLMIQRSTNGGNTVSYIYCNPPPSDPNNGRCTGTGILDAVNGANFIAPFILDPNNANTMLAGGLSLWRSIDIKSTDIPNWAIAKAQSTPVPGPTPTPTPSPGGTPFPTPAPVPISAIAVAKGSSDLVFVGHNDGQIYISQDGTNATPTWTRVNNGTPGRFVTRLTIDESRVPAWVYATFGGFNNNNVWVSKDLGTTWSDVSGGSNPLTDLPAVPVRSIVINQVDNKKLYVGTEVGIFASEDAGANWQLPQGGPAKVSVDELFWYQGDLFAATHGRGIYKTRVPVIDFAKCAAVGSPGDPPCPPGESFCRSQNPPNGGCCRVGDWDCSCTWASRRVPNQNLDVSVSCPITAHNGGLARNMYVGSRLTIAGPTVTVFGDVTNVGLIESAPLGSGLTADNLINIRPSPAVTNAGVILINDRLRISGDIANYGIITGAGIEVDKTGAPATTVHRLSGSGFWGNSFLRVNQTGELASNVTLDTPVTYTSIFKLNNFSLTANGEFRGGAELDTGTGALNVRGGYFTSGNRVIGTGPINVSPNDGSSDISVFSPGGFQPPIRVLSGTVTASLAGTLDGSITIDPGAVLDYRGTMDLNGNLTNNGAVVNNGPSADSRMTFNGTTLTNNGSMFVDFLYFNNSGTARTQAINGNGPFGGRLAQIGVTGSPSNTTLTGDVRFNQGEFLVGPGSTLNLSFASRLTHTGSSLTNYGSIIGEGTLAKQPSGGQSSLTGQGSYMFSSGITIASGQVVPSLRASGPFTIDTGATLSGGSLIFGGDLFLNNGTVAGTSLAFGSLNFQPISQRIFGGGTYTGPGGQLYINPESTTTLFTNVTYAGASLFVDGRLNTGSFTFELPCSTTWGGTGDALGNIRRTDLSSCPGAAIAFGNPFTTVQFTSGTTPFAFGFNVALVAPGDFSNAVGRSYLIDPFGTTGYTATLRLHYRDSELNGNNESTMQLWRNNGVNWFVQGATNRNTVDNWVELAGVTQFSPWTIANPPAPPPPPTPPSAPSGLAATAVSRTQINLAWVDNSATETGFKIERCNKGKSCTNFVEVAQVVGDVTAFSDNGLSGNTLYRYRVRAFNAAGDSAYSNIASAKTPRR